MKRESIPFIKRRERGGERVHERTVKKGVYSAVQVTTNGASIFCWKEGREEEDGTGLPVSQ